MVCLLVGWWAVSRLAICVIDQSVRQLCLCTQHLILLTKRIQGHCKSFEGNGAEMNGR